MLVCPDCDAPTLRIVAKTDDDKRHFPRVTSRQLHHCEGCGFVGAGVYTEDRSSMRDSFTHGGQRLRILARWRARRLIRQGRFDDAHQLTQRVRAQSAKRYVVTYRAE